MSNYKVEYAEGTKSPVVRDETGNAIPLDPHDPRFCRFLSWASKEPHPPSPFESLAGCGSFFTTVTDLIEHCKQRGVTLQVLHPPDHEMPMLSTRGSFRITVGDADLYFPCLERCVAIPEESGYMAPNGVTGEFTAIDLSAAQRPVHSPIHVSTSLLTELDEDLQTEDSDVRRVSSWTVERAFVYIDVSDFSTLPAGHQVLVINSLIEASAACNARVLPRLARVPEASLCIGDGYIYVFKAASAATEFAAFLAHEIEMRVAKKMLPVEFHFRIGVHIGPVFRFWDPGRNDWNFIGDGINGGNRVLSAMGRDTDDVVFVSSAIRDNLIAEAGAFQRDRSLLLAMRSRGRHTDKQGRRWRIYELHVGTACAM